MHLSPRLCRVHKFVNSRDVIGVCTKHCNAFCIATLGFVQLEANVRTLEINSRTLQHPEDERFRLCHSVEWRDAAV